MNSFLLYECCAMGKQKRGRRKTNNLLPQNITLFKKLNSYGSLNLLVMVYQYTQSPPDS